MADAEITVLLSIIGSASGAVSALKETDRALEATARRMMIWGREAWVIGTTLTAAVTAPAIGLATAGIAHLAQYDDAMHKVMAISDYVKKNETAVWNQIIDLSKKYGRSATDAANALYFIESAGITGTKAIEMLNVAMKSSVAGLTKPEVVIRGLVAIMSAYRGTTLSLNDASDILFKTVDRGVMTYEQLVGSLQQVAPSAAIAKVPLQDLGAAYILMTRAGFSADEAGTAINRMILDFFKPASKASKLAQQLGIDFSADALAAKGLGGVISDISKKLGVYQAVSDVVGEATKRQLKELSIQKTATTATAKERILNLERERDALRDGAEAQQEAIEKRIADLQTYKLSYKLSTAQRRAVDRQIAQLRQQKKEIQSRAKTLNDTIRNERRQLTATNIQYQKQRAQLLANALTADKYEQALRKVAKTRGLTLEQARTLFPDVRALRAWLVLSAEGGEAFKEAQEEMRSYAGATDRVFEEQSKSIREHWNRMIAAFQAIPLKLGPVVEPTLISFIDKLTDLANWFDNLSIESKKFILKLVALAASFGPALIVIGNTIRFLGLMMFAFTGARKAMAHFLLGGIPGLVGLGVKLVALAGIAGILRSAWERNFLGLQTTLRPILMGVRDSLLKIVPPELRDELKKVFDKLFPEAKDVALIKFGPVVDAVEGIIDRIIDLASPIVKIWEGIAPRLEMVFTMLKVVVIDDFLIPVSKIMFGFLGVAEDKWKTSFSDAIIVALNAVLDKVIEMLVRLHNHLIRIDWAKVASNAKDVMKDVKDAVLGIILFIAGVDWGKVFQDLGDALRAAKKLFDDFVGFVRSIDWDAVGAGLQKAKDAISGVNDVLDRLGLKSPQVIALMASWILFGGTFARVGWFVAGVLGRFGGLFMKIIEILTFFVWVSGNVGATLRFAFGGALGQVLRLLQPFSYLLSMIASELLPFIAKNFLKVSIILAIVGVSIQSVADYLYLLGRIWEKAWAPVVEFYKMFAVESFEEFKAALQEVGDALRELWVELVEAPDAPFHFLIPAMQKLGEFVEILKAAWAAVLQGTGVLIIVGALTTIGSVFKFLAFVLRDLAGKIRAFKTHFKDFVTLAIQKGNELLKLAGSLQSKIPEFISALVSFFASVLGKIGELIASIFSNVVAWIAEKISNIINWVATLPEQAVELIASSAQGIAASAGGLIADTASSLWGFLQTSFGDLLAFIETAFADLWGFIQSVVADPLGFLEAALRKVWDLIVSVFEGPINLIESTFSDLWTYIQSSFADLWGLITGEFSGLISFMEAVLADPWAFLESALATVVSLVAQIVESIVTQLSSIPGAFWDTMNEAFNTIIGWGASMIEAGKSIINNLITGIVQSVPGLEETLTWLRGFFPSSPARYGPFSKLPDWRSFLAFLPEEVRSVIRTLEQLQLTSPIFANFSPAHEQMRTWSGLLSFLPKEVRSTITALERLPSAQITLVNKSSAQGQLQDLAKQSNQAAVQFQEVGSAIAFHINSGFAQNFWIVGYTMQNAIGYLISLMRSMSQTFVMVGQEWAFKLSEGIYELRTQALPVFYEFQRLILWFGALMSIQMYNAGAILVQSFIDGMRSKLEDLFGFLEWLRGLFPSSPAKHGPFAQLPDWSALFSGLDNQFATAIALPRHLPPFRTEMRSAPISIRVFIGDHEIRDVVMDWEYQTIANALSG